METPQTAYDGQEELLLDPDPLTRLVSELKTPVIVEPPSQVTPPAPVSVDDAAVVPDVPTSVLPVSEEPELVDGEDPPEVVPPRALPTVSRAPPTVWVNWDGRSDTVEPSGVVALEPPEEEPEIAVPTGEVTPEMVLPTPSTVVPSPLTVPLTPSIVLGEPVERPNRPLNPLSVLLTPPRTSPMPAAGVAVAAAELAMLPGRPLPTPVKARVGSCPSRDTVVSAPPAMTQWVGWARWLALTERTVAPWCSVRKVVELTPWCTPRRRCAEVDCTTTAWCPAGVGGEEAALATTTPAIAAAAAMEPTAAVLAHPPLEAA